MPTYDYRCAACDHEFEQYQSITAETLKTCPACGRRKLERLLGTGGGVIFKGSGFYQTDYRSESYRKAAEAEKNSGKPDAGKLPADKLAGESSAVEKPSKTPSDATPAGKKGPVKASPTRT